MKFAQDKIINAVSMAADIESEAVLLDQIFGYAAQCRWTGSPSGTLKLQASCQIIHSGETITDWDDVSGASVTVESVSTNGTLFNADAQFYKYFRVIFDRTGGTGSLTVTYNGKG